MKLPNLTDDQRCPYCGHALHDHDTKDWDDYYCPVTCWSCDCTVTDPDVLQRIADAHNARPD